MEQNSQKEFLEALESKCTTFRAQPSLLDIMFRHSWISKTPYKGMYNLFIFIGTFGLGVDIVVHLLSP